MIEYKGKQLTCTQEELDAFISSIEYDSSIHSFEEEYNGFPVENNTGNGNAVYVVVTIAGGTVLQPFIPNISGYSPILPETAQEVIDEIVTSYIDQQVFMLYGVKPKTSEELLAERITDLELTLAEMMMV